MSDPSNSPDARFTFFCALGLKHKFRSEKVRLFAIQFDELIARIDASLKPYYTRVSGVTSCPVRADQSSLLAKAKTTSFGPSTVVVVQVEQGDDTRYRGWILDPGLKKSGFKNQQNHSLRNAPICITLTTINFILPLLPPS
uniref:Tudor domain-containing protein n=1 Tax=Steinernema glaseri TaxID=37863 RepID=A0A1I8AI32_9BILA